MPQRTQDDSKEEKRLNKKQKSEVETSL